MAEEQCARDATGIAYAGEDIHAAISSSFIYAHSLSAAVDTVRKIQDQDWGITLTEY